MERSKKILTLSLTTLLALSLVASVASAGNDNTTGEVSFSVIGFVERDPNDSAKFEEYRDVPSGLVLDHVAFSWWGDGGGFVDLDIVDAVQDDQRISFEAGRFDLFQASIDWNETPHRWSDQAWQMHGYSGASDGLAYFSLPDSFQEAMQFGMTDNDVLLADFVDGSALQVPAYKHRETGSADFRFTPSRNAVLGFTFTRDRRDGYKWHVNPTYFSDAGSEVSLPIDYVTDTLQVYAEINRRHWRLGGRLEWSEFDTGIDTILWDQQLFVEEDAAGHVPTMMVAGEVDHETFKWTLDGGFRLPGNTNINWVISQGETETDDYLLPKTTSVLLDPESLPIDRFRGEYDSNLYSFRLSSHPIDWFGIKAWWRKYEYENDSSRVEFADYVTADHRVASERWTMQQGYDKTQAGVGLMFTPADWVDIGVSYENVDMDREDAAVHEQDEDIFTVNLDFDVSEHVFLRAKYRWLDRDSSEYDFHYLVHESYPGEADFASNYGARRFYWADREREEWSLLGEFTINPQFAIYAEATHAESDYEDPNTGYDLGDSWTPSGVEFDDRTFMLAGRIDDEDTSYTIGFSASSPNHRVNFAIDHTWEEWEWSMASRYRQRVVWSDDPDDDWFSKANDEYRTLHVTFDAELDEAGLWSLLADLTWSKGEGEVVSFASDIAGDRSSGNVDTQWPETETELTVFQLSVTRELSEAWEVGLQYWYEKWEEMDWQHDMFPAYLLDGTSDQYLGRDYFDYENHVISLMATYKF